MTHPTYRFSVAVRAGNTDEAEAAIADGADVHAEQDVALYWAARGGDVRLIGTLLALGADVRTRDHASLTIAAIKGYTEAVRLLLAAAPDAHGINEALRLAAAEGQTEVVRLLLVGGADVHVRDDVALRQAATFKRTEVVRTLLAAGADPVAAWACSTDLRETITATLDDCGDAMTAEQCAKLAAASSRFVKLRAMIGSAGRRPEMQRR